MAKKKIKINDKVIVKGKHKGIVKRIMPNNRIYEIELDDSTIIKTNITYIKSYKYIKSNK